MTRINTNVSSLNAQKTLGRSNAQLQEAMTRLSTGLRINSGKDDPAGLIASEMLRSDIVSTERAISNSQRANQMIATADSALDQVSSLLNDIRGLVTETANTGAMSPDQIAANQLQVDSALESLNRIAQVTSFQGRKLLDGSLDFTTTAGANFEKISSLEIQQANLGATGSMALTVTVTAAATQAQVDLTDIPAATEAVNAYDVLAFENDEAQAIASFNLVSAPTVAIQITALDGGRAEGAAGNDITVEIVDDAGGDTATYNELSGVIEVTANIGGGAIDAAAIAALIQGIDGGADFTASVSAGDGGTFLAAADEATYDPLNFTTYGRDAGEAEIRVVSDTAGAAANGVTVTVNETGTTVDDAEASIDDDGNIVVALNGTVSYAQIADAIDGLTGYSASITSSSGDANYVVADDDVPAAATLANGLDASGGLAQDVVFSLAGKDGSQVFSFSEGTTIAQMEAAINLLSDSTGVSASTDGTTLELVSTDYGEEAFVDIQVISEAAGGTITAAVGQGARETGTDIEGRINGTEANGTANALSLDTATLAMSFNVDAGYSGNITLTIDGGGAMFQLGPVVVSNQQSRMGISSVNTASLGGANGRLYELGSGESAALASDPTKAAQIIDEVINKVTSLRGRLGAFQKTTLDSNIASLSDTLENLVSAESAIRDADFAAEAAALTRAQILVQSGTSVLAIANQNPQNVLALLR